MRLGRNLAAGFGGSVITAVIGLAVVPFYLRALGIGAYGLIGFFAAMQALVQVLDFGLAPSMNREVARGQALKDLIGPRNLLRTLSLISFATAAAIAIVTIVTAHWIGEYWFQRGGLPLPTIERSIMLMGVIMGLRWPMSLYAGALQGAHRIQTAAGLSTIAAVSGSIGGVVVVAFVSPKIEAYFCWQTAVALLQLVALRIIGWRALGGTVGSSVRWSGLKHIWRFAAGMAVTSLLGILFMQLDKMVLSRVVTLDELGRYTIAGLAARSLYLILTPVFNVILPRLCALVALGNTDDVVEFYRTGTRLLLAALFPLALFVSVFARDIYMLWTGNAELASHVALAAALLLLGSAMNGAMHFPYALQLAYGRSRLPATINFILIIVFVPLIFFLTRAYGIVGAAAAWAILNTLYLFVGTWITHRVILRGIGQAWIVKDVGIPFGVSTLIVGGGSYVVKLIGTSLPVNLALGAILTMLAFMTVVALSSKLLLHARSLWPRLPFSRSSYTLPEML